eukprot:CAMPEP_0115074526 /NCGR_PEP_ID=MMETSP0227-20121206/15384_1 /TAXON_ID=89957 /ORGANISM="Polarella glacialis, Strain CCMP 1383" /LENGTH=950 /DNA_ID=CAMNT_0002461493 /DNA_START=120 /DNA_END=2972 /DNA_ORIENTATION=-
MKRFLGVTASLLATKGASEVSLRTGAMGKPSLIESCTPESDTKGFGLGVTLGPWTNKDFCDMHDATSSVDNLLDSCTAFCGKENIPLLIGVPTSYGFSLASMDRVCLGETDSDGKPAGLLGEYDKGLMVECKERSEALEEIKEKMAHLVAAVELMKLEQIRFRAALQAKMQAFIQELASPAFELSMKAAVDKIGLFTKFMQAELTDTIFANGEDRARMLKSVQTIGDMGVQLRETMAQNMPLLEDYAERCGHPVLATSETKGGKYLLDLCFQDKALCVDDPNSQHVGCCCGSIPAAGSFTIPAETWGRRLAQSQASSIDICAEADQIGKGRLQELKDSLDETPLGRQLLEAFEAKMFQQYPEYFGQCSADSDSSRRLDAQDPRGFMERAAMTAAEALGIKHKVKVPKMHCEPQSGKFTDTDGSKEKMQTAFWSQSEVDTCDMLDNGHGAKMKTQDLADVCADFCGSDSLPLLVGTVAFGFNKTAIDSVCVDSSTLTTDEVKVKQCLREASAMNAVEVKVASAAASLMSLESAKLFYEASVRATIPEMRAIIRVESQDSMRYADVGEKVTALENILNRSLASVSKNSAAAMSLKTALHDLDERAQELHETLVIAMADFIHFIQDCNQLFTGKGASHEYMLDVCSQTSLQCIEEDISRHVGCCCGYLPLLAVGKTSLSLTQTIPGIMAPELSDIDAKARVANVEYPKEKDEEPSEYPKEKDEEPSDSPPRRLQAQKDVKEAQPEQDFSICGAAYKQALPRVQEAEKKIKQLGQEEFLNLHLAQLSEKYPGYAICQAEASVEGVEGEVEGVVAEVEGLPAQAEASVEAAVGGVEASVEGAVAGVEAEVAGVEASVEGAVGQAEGMLGMSSGKGEEEPATNETVGVGLQLTEEVSHTPTRQWPSYSQPFSQAAVGLAVVALAWTFLSEVRHRSSDTGLAEPMLARSATQEASGP